MGSAFSGDAAHMRLLLSMVKERKLFYFDSHTTSTTVAAVIQKELGMTQMRNDLFLDVEDTPAFMHKQLATLRARVARKGYGVAIGHVQRKHLIEVLREGIPQFAKD